MSSYDLFQTAVLAVGAYAAWVYLDLGSKFSGLFGSSDGKIVDPSPSVKPAVPQTGPKPQESVKQATSTTGQTVAEHAAYKADVVPKPMAKETTEAKSEVYHYVPGKGLVKA